VNCDTTSEGEGKPCTSWGAGQWPEPNMVLGVGVGLKMSIK
jgi:hypothetical protein